LRLYLWRGGGRLFRLVADPAFGWHSLMALGGILPLLFAPLLIWLLPESVRFLVVKRAPAAHPGDITTALSGTNQR
jgi:hypothetical protein